MENMKVWCGNFGGLIYANSQMSGLDSSSWMGGGKRVDVGKWQLVCAGESIDFDSKEWNKQTNGTNLTENVQRFEMKIKKKILQEVHHLWTKTTHKLYILLSIVIGFSPQK